MRWLLLLLTVLPAPAQGLRYRLKLWFRGAEAPVEGRFTVDTTPPTRSRNHVQKPRLGGWTFRPVAGEARAAEALILARAPGLVFLSTPVPQARPTTVRVTVGGRPCAFWGLRTPANLVASVALTEVAPRMLAVLDLSAEPRHGELAKVELHLESIGRLSSAAPPQDGTALLDTLDRWAEPADDDGAVTVLSQGPGPAL